MNRLKLGEIDLAFYPTVAKDKTTPEIESENIFKYRNSLILNKNHPLANIKDLKISDVEKYPYMVLDKYTFYNPNEVINFKLSNIEFENGNWEIMMGLIKENLAMAGMSDKITNRYSNFEANFVKKDFDKVLPAMYYSIFYKRNIIQKDTTTFIINKLREDKDI